MLTPTDQKPLLRGYFHLLAFFLFSGASILLLKQASGARETKALAIYSVSLIELFGVSAFYHRPQWKTPARAWLRRLDHSSIFVLIAGTGTPICLLSLSQETGLSMLRVTWGAAALGVLLSLFWVNAPKWIPAALAVAFGWIVIPYLPELNASLDATSIWCLLAGGVVYTLGAIVYATKRPNPSPRVFGYHEIFHLLVILGAAIHFAMIFRFVSARGMVRFT